MNSSRRLVGNWKMYLSGARCRDLANALITPASQLHHTEMWVAPPFPFLGSVSETLRGSSVRVGSQNVHWEREGAFTGEVSVDNVKECGCSFAIVGHSERRAACFETPAMIADRAACSLAAALDTIICIGETLDHRKRGETKSVLHAQLSPVLDRLSPEVLPKACIAYEPVWAIGTDRYPSNDEIHEAHSFIAEAFERRFGTGPCILYGGSVTPENYAEILKVPLVHGALVGRASLKADQFIALAKISDGLPCK